MTQISWDSFKIHNIDGRGLHLKFEDLCRQLFVNEFLSDNVQCRFLHSDPNNAGLEAEPILDDRSGRRIGFQAKYFDNDANYKLVHESAKQIVTHYSGQVDHVYLYSNLSLKSASLNKTVQLLANAGISLELVTNDSVLDCVRKYPYLGLYYFGNHSISYDWFQKIDEYMFQQLGERFNSNFHVDTTASDELSLFVQDEAAILSINNRKRELLDMLQAAYWKEAYCRSYLISLKDAIERIPDVDGDNILDVLSWEENILHEVEGELSELKHKALKLEKERNELLERVECLGAKQEEERRATLRSYREKNNEFEKLLNLMSLPKQLLPTEREIRLLREKILFVEGFAGIGKSQLLANETRNLLEQHREVLLNIAGVYNSSDPVLDQIMKNLRLDYSLEELIDILEAIGEKNNRVVPLFIDALNETWHQELWKTGLPVLCDKIAQTRYVRLVVTYRPEYESLLFSDGFRERLHHGDILTLYHRGFEDNSFDAIAQFFDFYNIPFTPMEYLGYEMANPLFLTLYCKTYNGEEVDLPTVYERLIVDLNIQLWKSLTEKLRSEGYSPDDDMIKPLVLQFAARLAEMNERSMTRAEVCKLPYWDEYKLTPAPVLRVLCREHFLHQSVVAGIERYYFSYDQMNDIYVSEALFENHGSQEQLRMALVEDILQLKDGHILKPWNVDLFVHLCARYTYTYHEECIDVIDRLEDSDDLRQIIDRFFASFSWRRKDSVSVEEFLHLMDRYHPNWDVVFSMLIGHSTKVTHPLNADFLHQFLSGYKLATRDALWTTYINSLERENRVCDLVQKYASGIHLKVKSEKQIQLLLTLFGWLLTSSNRWLRDVTSKAMIEILKEHFGLCLPLLQKFAEVNDPYVISRLYGVVFGACSKRCEEYAEEFRNLTEYVYEHVFCPGKVYPDILLRDYARLIIELYCHEFPDTGDGIDRTRIVPPYVSDPLPILEIPEKPPAPDFSSGLGAIYRSLMFDGMGMYGDFGRYVFQSALRHFDVDQKQVFWYAIDYITLDLGYTEDLFGKYDNYVEPFSYDRHRTIKRERIGKKYQWIAMYNILARVSDNCPHTERPAWDEDGSSVFEGAWDPYVRDFDPTLSTVFMQSPKFPQFSQWNSFLAAVREEVNSADARDAKSTEAWLRDRGVFYSTLKDAMVQVDADGTQWVGLTGHCDTRSEQEMRQERLQVWSWQYAFFMAADKVAEFQSNVDKRISILTHEITGTHDTYTIFNREYPWSPSCRQFNVEAWVDVQLATGETEEYTYKEPEFDFTSIEELKNNYPEWLKETHFFAEEMDASHEPVIHTSKRDVMRDVGKSFVLPGI